MSQHIYQTTAPVLVTLGYDRPLDYVFCTIMTPSGAVLYSNLDDDNAGSSCQDVEYFRGVLEELGLMVPETMFAEVQRDQSNKVGNRVVRHSANTELNLTV
jgi:hypothetical protein